MQVQWSIAEGSGVLNGTTFAKVKRGEANFDEVNISLLSTSVSSHMHVLSFRAGVRALSSNPFIVTFGASKSSLATFPPRHVNVGKVFVAQLEIAGMDLKNNVVTSFKAIFTASVSMLNTLPGTSSQP